MSLKDGSGRFSSKRNELHYGDLEFLLLDRNFLNSYNSVNSV